MCRLSQIVLSVAEKMFAFPLKRKVQPRLVNLTHNNVVTSSIYVHFRIFAALKKTAAPIRLALEGIDVITLLEAIS